MGISGYCDWNPEYADEIEDMPMKFITVDIGSTFIKAGLFDVLRNNQVETIKYPTPARMPDTDNTCYVNDAGEIVRIIKGIIHDCCNRYPDTQGILFSTQQHGCVVCHPEMEDVYISWQDTRCLKKNSKSGKTYIQELKEIFSRESMVSNGVYIKPALALCNLYAMFEEKGLSRTCETHVHTLGSYMIEKLTGRGICHITNAAPMGFADILTNTWRHDMLKKIGLDFICLPEITNKMECCGYYQDGSVSIAVFPDVGDVQTSVYGTDAGVGDLIINIGTSGQLIYITDRFVPGNYEIRPFYENNYCNVISCMPGGRNFDVQIDYIRDIGEKIFERSLEREEIWKRLHQIGPWHTTEGVEVDCGFYELPDRLGDGSILHIDHSNLKLRNVMWATAVDFGKKYRMYADYLWGQEGQKGNVYFTGGAILKNRELREAIQQELGIQEVICAPDDEVFRGMQKLALECVERISENETGDHKREGSNRCIPVRNSSAKFAPYNAGVRS